ncbi:MAG TPA: chemotaxis protein CheA [Terriglobales bacterium]|nr:chemotaxis protein CheA [Terriglobales bacterium]
MKLFDEERAGELRELFFESALELLQVLNEQGLELEKNPGDAETVRAVRRTVHTLKGDSAACGYRELSELAHELEDALTPEMAARAGRALAEVVLGAADVFEAMLRAFRSGQPVPSGEPVRVAVRALIEGKPEPSPKASSAPSFSWSEYELVVIADAARQGAVVHNVLVTLDPQCAMRGAAVQLVRNVLDELGTVLAMRPEEVAPETQVAAVEAALASERSPETIAQKCRIPAVVAGVRIERWTPAAETEQVEADFPAAGTAASQATAATAPAEKPGAPRTTLAENVLRVDAERIDQVLNLVGELIIGKSMLHQVVLDFERRFPKDPLRARLADTLAFQARVLNDLQKGVMKVRMVPAEQLFRRFPRIVRDVAHTQGKQVTTVLSGQDTELDKSILDTLAEPLTHLVRNAVDHGIGTPEDRAAAGKPREGTVRLDAYHQGNQVVIEVADDGRGIDRNKVMAKAIERGLISAEDAARLSDSEALALIFHPGLSTAEQVTAISGRGVGMDVVKTVVDGMKGTISIESEPGRGTRFFLRVPLTLAIIKALLFRVEERMYAVPLASVVEIARAPQSEIRRVGEHEVIRLRNEVLTVVRLDRLAGRPAGIAPKVFVIVVALGERKFGLIVDRLVGEEELVIKALEDRLVSTEFVSGASILGDGTVVLILNLAVVVERLSCAVEEEVPA